MHRHPHHMKRKERVCELCNQQASLYCAFDSTFLYWKCDAAIHNANFLVACHCHHLLCSHCNCFIRIHIFGTSTRRSVASNTCCSCSPLDNHSNNANSFPSPSSPSSFACVDIDDLDTISTVDDDLDVISAGTYYVWPPNLVQASSNRCKKSNSTGSSSLPSPVKQWKLLDLLCQSNRDKKDLPMFLMPSSSSSSLGFSSTKK